MSSEDQDVHGFDGAVVGSTSISWVGGETGELVYRGFDVVELLPKASFESVVHLLLLGEPPGPETPANPIQALADRRRLPPAIAALPDSWELRLPPIDGFRTLVSMMGGDSFHPPPTVDQGLTLVAQCPEVLARYARRCRGLPPIPSRKELGHVANYLWMLNGAESEPAKVRALEQYFVLLADHGMNPSTLALRAVISTGSDLPSGVTAAISALKGPAHGGATAMVSEMLDAIGTPGSAERWIRLALARGERLYGFGHRAYKVEDPRSTALKRIAREVADRERFELAVGTEVAALSALRLAKPGRRLFANVEFYASVVLEAVGLPRELFTPTFALARTAGWSAHAIEQAQTKRLLAPELKYVGAPRGRRWPDR